jgi:hypothetical protein
MKALLKVLFVSLLLLGSVHAQAEDGTTGSSSKDKSLFVLKTNKKFIGAKVEVYQSNGELIASKNLDKRKVFIDFGGVRLGTYTIRVTKGAEVLEYQFEKK